MHAALTRAVHHAHNQLQGLAGDRARSSENVLQTAQETIAGVEATARRLTGSAPSRAITALSPPVDRIPAARGPRPPLSAPPASPPPSPSPPRRPR